MSMWGGGYVSDVEYTAGFYRHQAPPHLGLAGLLGGVDPAWPPPEDTAHYLEIGCGRGLTATLMAASNPGWRVTAIDYNPAHVAQARVLARRAGLDNITFLEADLTTLAEAPLAAAIAPADYVTFHGVWSWVSPAVRAGIVRLLRDKVVPGGLVHVSYNSLPAWQGSLVLQHVLYHAGRRAPGRSDQQVVAGLELARSLMEAKARYLAGDSMTRELVEGAATMPVQYLAHEYMNQYWAPCYHADVVADMAPAKLEYVASVNLLENFPDLTMTPEVRAIYDRTEDPILRELVKDTALPRQLRNDLFVRGKFRISDAERNARLRELTLALVVSKDQVKYALDTPAGSAELGPAFRPMVAALAEGPKKVGDLLDLVPGHSNPAELAAALVGTNQAVLVARPGAGRGQSADRLNLILSEEARMPAGREAGTGLASFALGAAFPVGALEQFVYGRLRGGEGLEHRDEWAGRFAPHLPEDKRDELRTMLEKVVGERTEMFDRLL